MVIIRLDAWREYCDEIYNLYVSIKSKIHTIEKWTLLSLGLRYTSNHRHSHPPNKNNSSGNLQASIIVQCLN